MDKQTSQIIKDLREKYEAFRGTNCADKILTLCLEYEKLDLKYHELIKQLAKKAGKK